MRFFRELSKTQNRISLLATLLLMGVTNSARAEEVEIPVLALMGPTFGYETKNNIQIVLYGYLPNDCYSLGNSQIDKDPTSKTITVRQFAFRDRSGICDESAELPSHNKIQTSFTTEVSVGTLPIGTYQFNYQLPGGEVGKREINVAPNKTLSIDSLPYANISNAMSREVINGTEDLKVTLSGVLNSSCAEVNDEVKKVKENDVFVLMPTVKVHPGVCNQVLVPFTKVVNLGKPTAGRYLVHVRSKNGKSHNQVIQVAR